MPRIPMVSPDSLTPEQQRVYDEIVAGPRGAVVGPLRAALHSPELADHWQKLGEFLRYRTSLPRKLNELAIIVTGRRWNSQIEWHVHAKAAREAGLGETVIEAIKFGRAPEFEDPDEAAIYEYARELQQDGVVSDATYAEVASRWGAVGVVELTAVIGYYTMVSMTLNAHHVPLPEGVEPPLEPVGRLDGGQGRGLTALPAARLPQAAGLGRR